MLQAYPFPRGLLKKPAVIPHSVPQPIPLRGRSGFFVFLHRNKAAQRSFRGWKPDDRVSSIRGLFPKTEPDSICYFAGFAVRSRADSFPVRSSRLLTGRTPPMDHNGKEIPPLETGRGTGGRNGTDLVHDMVQNRYRTGTWNSCPSLQRRDKSGESRGAASHFCKINIAPLRGYVVFCYKNPAKTT